MELDFESIKNDIVALFEKTHFAILATADKNGVVCTAQMCLVNDGLTVYMQTDSKFQKIQNIKENPNVAINNGAYNFKGKATIVGHPNTNKLFIEKLKTKHLKTYNLYTDLQDEVLIKIDLTEARIWDMYNDKTNIKVITAVDFVTKQVAHNSCDAL